MSGAEIPRDRWGRPLVQPPEGGKPVPYARASSFGDVLDDKTNLAKWQLRMACKGLSIRPELALAAATTPLEEKWKLNKIAEDAIEAAGGSAKATVGTSLHTLTELLDRSEPLPAYPAQYERDLAAYQAATKPFKHHLIEQFVVNDELQVAGTPDRVSEALERLVFGTWHIEPSEVVIGDLKTGGHPDYLGKYAVQLAIYSRSCLYDPATGERSPLPDIYQGLGVVFHMPAGEGRCDLYALDLQAGYEGARLAADVRKWRARKGLSVSMTSERKAA